MDDMDTATLVTILCVFVGFLLFGGAFAGFMYKKPPVLIGALLVAALILVTIIPVGVAVFVGTSAG